MMNRALKPLFVTLLALSLTACATSGAVYRDSLSHYAPVKDGEARLFIYRASSLGMIFQPSVYLDGQKVGNATPNSFFVRDIPVGPHHLSVSTEVEKTYDFNAAPRSTTYIRLAPSIGWVAARIQIEPVSEQEAAGEMADLHTQSKQPEAK